MRLMGMRNRQQHRQSVWIHIIRQCGNYMITVGQKRITMYSMHSLETGKMSEPMKWFHHAVQDNLYFNDEPISSFPAITRIAISTIYERNVPIEFIEKYLIAGLIDYDDYDTIKQNCIS